MSVLGKSSFFFISAKCLVAFKMINTERTALSSGTVAAEFG